MEFGSWCSGGKYIIVSLSGAAGTSSFLVSFTPFFCFNLVLDSMRLRVDFSFRVRRFGSDSRSVSDRCFFGEKAFCVIGAVWPDLVSFSKERSGDGDRKVFLFIRD